MSNNVIGGKAHGQQVSRRPSAQLFVQDKFLGEFEFVIVRKRSGAYDFVEACGGAIFALLMSGGAQCPAVSIAPFPVPILAGAIAGIEVIGPLGKLLAIVGGSDPGTGLRIDPVGCIASMPGGKNGSAILQPDTKDTGFAACRQFEFVSQRAGQQVVRGGTLEIPRNPDEMSSVVFHRCNHALLLRVPPLVGGDAVAIR